MVVQNSIPKNLENDGDLNGVEVGEGGLNGHNGRLSETNGGPGSDQGSDTETPRGSSSSSQMTSDPRD